MTALLLLWLVSLVLVGIALLAMALLIVARVVRAAREERRQTVRRRLLPLLLAAGEGGADEDLLAETRRHELVAADLAIELFELVRGDDLTRFAALLAEAGIPNVLMRRLVKGDERARILAAETLAFFPGEASRQALDQALDDRSGDVRLAAAIALADSGSTPPLRRLVTIVSSGEEIRTRRLVELFRRMAEERSAQLLELARDATVPVAVRAACVEALATTGNYTLVQALAEIADQARHDAGPELVAECVRALGELRHPSGRSTIDWGLGSADWQVRAEAAEAAGRIGLVEVAPRLGALLADDVWWVRFRAGEALAALGEAGRDTLRELAHTGGGRKQRTAALILAERGLA